MATHGVAIVKASFAASLFRSDPTSVPRDAIAAFHVLLQEAIATGSRVKIQACKAWLLDKVIPSSGRTTVLAKYLGALSAANVGTEEGRNGSTGKSSPKRTRLHTLYLLNDLLHHTKYHIANTTHHALLVSSIQPQLVALFSAAGSFNPDKNKKHFQRLDELLDIWERNEYYATTYVAKLRVAIKQASENPEGPQDETSSSTQRSVKDVPYALPATHGDASQRWHDLPAGNLLPHIMPDSAIPIDPKQVKPLQFTAGPADESMVTTVKSFLEDVKNMPDRKREYTVWDEDLTPDLDPMGHALVKQGDNGIILPKENRYGWSIEFCEILKKRKKSGLKAARLPGDHDAGQSLSRSVSRGRSQSRSKSRSQSHGRDWESDQRAKPRPRNRRRRRNTSSPFSSSRSRSPSPRRKRSPSAQGQSPRAQPRSRSPRYPQFKSAGQQPPTRRDSSAAPTHQPQFHQANQASYSPSSSQQSGYAPPPPFSQQQHPTQYSTHHQQPNFPMQMQMPAPYSPYSNQNPPLVTPTAQVTASFPPPMVPPPPPQHGASYYQSAHNHPVDQNGLPLPPPPAFHKGPWPPPMQQTWQQYGNGQAQGYGQGQNGSAEWQNHSQGYSQNQNQNQTQQSFGGGLPARGGLGSGNRGGGRGGIGSGRGY